MAFDGCEHKPWFHHLFAEQAVAGIQVTDNCRYNDALEILRRRFKNTTMIEQKYPDNLQPLR